MGTVVTKGTGAQGLAATLDALIAIATWFGGRSHTRPMPAVATPSPQAPPHRSPLPMIVGLTAALAMLAGGFWYTSRPPPAPAPSPFAALDAVYRRRGDPLPPAPCRRPDQAGQLIAAADDESALGMLDGPE